MKKQAVQKRLVLEKRNSTFQERVHSAGFTLVELWVVMAIVAVLFAILLPAIAGSKVNSQVFRCLENTRRLTLAWRMYAEDNSDLMVYSSDDGSGTAAYQTTVATNKNQGDLYAWTWSKMDFNGANGFNWDTNADITLRPLWQYVKDATTYKCPADASQVTISSLPAGYTGTYTVGSIAPRIRSYSMNYYFGGFGGNTNETFGGPSEDNVKDYPLYFKLTALGNAAKAPGLNRTFVLIDERSDRISWGNFYTDMSGYPVGTGKANGAEYEWTDDMPASYHNYAGCVSFADGHAEIHRWQDQVVLQHLAPNGTTLNGGHGGGTTFPDPYGQDVPYMQSLATRPH